MVGSLARAAIILAALPTATHGAAHKPPLPQDHPQVEQQAPPRSPGRRQLRKDPVLIFDKKPPTHVPTYHPTYWPTYSPSLGDPDVTITDITARPTRRPTPRPTEAPTTPSPTEDPSPSPSAAPSSSPSHAPSNPPSLALSFTPSTTPSVSPSGTPSFSPSRSAMPSSSPSASPTISPTGAMVRTFDSGTEGNTHWVGSLVSMSNMDDHGSLPVMVALTTNDANITFILGFNGGHVTLARMEGGDESTAKAVLAGEMDDTHEASPTSTKVADLKVGENATLANWRDSGLELVVNVKSIDYGWTPYASDPMHADVEIVFGPQLTAAPSGMPSEAPSTSPPTKEPSVAPSISFAPTERPSSEPSPSPSSRPSESPSAAPSATPSASPTGTPSVVPSVSHAPSAYPSAAPTTRVPCGPLIQCPRAATCVYIPLPFPFHDCVMDPGAAIEIVEDDDNGLGFGTDSGSTPAPSAVVAGSAGDPGSSDAPATGQPSYPPTEVPTPAPTTETPTWMPSLSPTPPPTPGCGNGICEVGRSETSNNCSKDCVSRGYTTKSKGGSKASGQMFTLEASTEDVRINSLEVVGVKDGSTQCQVYTRSGDHRGHTTSSSGWKKILDKTVTLRKGASTNLGGLSPKPRIDRGRKQAFYIYCEKGLSYADGTSNGRSKERSGDGRIVIHEGVTTKKLFEKVEKNGKYSGGIQYDRSN